jgi:hypothetical protein
VRTDAQVMASQLRDLAGDLSEVISHIIQSQQQDCFSLENFRDALKKAEGVRIAMRHEADRLDPMPVVTP